MSLNHDINAIVEQINKLEQELKDLNLWGGEALRPSDKDLSSTSPFCLDTIEFHQWLEYVLIARFRSMIEADMALPQAMMTHTYAQEKYRGQWSNYRNLIGILQELDKLVTIAQLLKLVGPWQTFCFGLTNSTLCV